jgi:hypothetical protein
MVYEGRVTLREWYDKFIEWKNYVPPPPPEKPPAEGAFSARMVYMA